MHLSAEFMLGHGKLKANAGSHIIVLYQDKSELVEFLRYYFYTGLKNDEVCFMVNASDEMVHEITTHFEENGIDKKKIAQNLAFFKYKDLYFKKGKFDVASVFAKVDDMFEKNSSKRIRTSGDMTWFDNSDFDELERYETGLSQRYNGKDAVLSCAYYSKQLSVEQLIRLTQSHLQILFKEKGVWKLSETIERKISEQKIDELEKLAKLTIDREIKMIELKDKIAALEQQLKRAGNTSK